MERGFVKLWRKIEDSGLMGYGLKESGFLSYLLMNVNWKAKKWRGEWVHPGSLITSINNLSADIHESEKVTRRLIKLFEELGILKREVRANRWTKLSLCNWASYQDLSCTKGILRANVGKYKGKGAGKGQGGTTKEGKNKEGNNVINPFGKWDDKQFWEEILLSSKDKNYSDSMLSDFFLYWSELDSKGKMKFQLNKTWDNGRRLKKWSSNNFGGNTNQHRHEQIGQMIRSEGPARIAPPVLNADGTEGF